MSESGPRSVATGAAVGAILLVALWLRVENLGEASFWYDEVVTMRLAETPSPSAMVALLSEIDATRAPLHPLLLQGWLGVFGSSETAARSLSVLFGLATVALMYPLGRLAFDRMTGLWAMGLAAVSPLLVYYAREVRMYAPLVFLATLCWTLLFAMGRRPDRRTWLGPAYGASLLAMLFTHPLGLLMGGTLATASALGVRTFFGSWRAWAATHGLAVLAAAPWLPRYFDHAPEFLTGRLPVKFLIGTPIGFLGGNFLTLAGFAGLIAFGQLKRPAGTASERLVGWARVDPAAIGLLLWLVLPPTVLYAYSALANPIFGPSRYTVFCAPAFLVLIAQGGACLPPFLRGAVLLGLAAIALASPTTMPARARWRECARALQIQAARPGETPVAFVTSNAVPNVEAETARYYLGRWCRVAPYDEDAVRDALRDPGLAVYLAVGGRTDEIDYRFSALLKGATPVFLGGPDLYRLEPPRRDPPESATPPGPGTPVRTSPD